MNYIEENKKNQLNNEENKNFLMIPSLLEGFINTNTVKEKDNKGKDCYCLYGYVELSENDLWCDNCGGKMQSNLTYTAKYKHLPIGSVYSYICVNKKQLECPHCHFTKTQEIPFKEEKHFITKPLKTYAEDLLATNNFTNKEVAYLTGLNRNVVKEIDKERLIKQYTIDGEGKKLIKPEVQARFLGIDEFKLHDGYQYATHIIDYETGHILWIAKGKKKQVVYDFINHVGPKWMSKVEAVACDMNSDFEEAFEEKCPHIKIVYDYFHIVKNFNEKVVSEVRKDEQKRLEDEGNKEAARKLKRARFILTSNEETLKRKDEEAPEEKTIKKGSELFNLNETKRKGGNQKRYEELVNQNELFILIALIKELLIEAFSTGNEEEMAKLIFDIMELCEESGNKHFHWFKKLLYNHFNGIISHATYKLSSGKIEGINNKIKTLRRQAYGYPDDEYFFLKLFDMSRN